MLSFDNTEVAFSGKSNSELKWAHRLFQLIGNNKLIVFGKWATNFALAIRLPITGIIKKTIFKQFCGGENVEECTTVIKKLDEYGIGTILDYSVEAKANEDELEACCQELERGIKLASGAKEIPFVVFKVSGVAALSLLEKYNSQLPENDPKYDAVYARVDRLCKAAHEADTPIFIDAEETWIQETIDRIAEEMMVKYNKEKAIVYNTIQLYRWDRLEALKNFHKIAQEKGYHLGVKLVRGAYMEKEREVAKEKGYKSPIQSDKDSTDRDYDLAVAYCAENKIAQCAGTHNENSSLLLANYIEQNQLDKSDYKFYFAQLLGMSDHISFNLAKNGYNVAKYVPYGPVKEVIPYLIRRAEENTSVAGQTSRELGLISQEMKRRKLQGKV
ncbi:MAG: proline dehydrogenase family protein [Flavobacteriales bacterium]